MDKWHVTENGNLICNEDFTFDSMLKLDGDFADDAQRIQYAEAIASKLNAQESVRSEALEAVAWQVVGKSGRPKTWLDVTRLAPKEFANPHGDLTIADKNDPQEAPHRWEPLYRSPARVAEGKGKKP